MADLLTPSRKDTPKGTDWKAAAWAGVIAGLAFLMLEMGLVWLVQGQSPWGPPHMMAAMVLGQGVLPEVGTWAAFDLKIVMIAMMIHVPASIVYGFIGAWLVHRFDWAVAVMIGAGFGVAIYVGNFYFVAPVAFPWFEMGRNWIGAFSHLMFGAILGAAYIALRRTHRPAALAGAAWHGDPGPRALRREPDEPAPPVPATSWGDRLALWLLLWLPAVLALLLGLGMAGLGAWLLALGGSLYYLVAGVAIVFASVMILRGRHGAGVALFAATVVATVIWALLEIAGKAWMHAWGVDLAGRVGVLFSLLMLMGLGLALRSTNAPAAPRGAHGQLRTIAWPLLFLVLAMGGTTFVLLRGPYFAAQAQALVQADVQAPRRAGSASASAVPGVVVPSADTLHGDATTVAAARPDAVASAPADARIGRAGAAPRPDEWTAYGGSNLGQRFAQATQITPTNVGSIEKVWEFHTGDFAPNKRVFFAFQNTPLKIDNSMYVCSSSGQVFALDPATGRLQWHFNPKVALAAMAPMFSVTCRAVAYHEAAQAAPGAECPRRILLATVDSRLIALDARTGQVCPGFGTAGTVDLGAGIANQAPGLSSNNSGPVVVGNRVIVGQQVSDNQRRDAPSGVVRAYDVVTGALVWAWDAKRTDRPRQALAAGEIWPRGTPNVWTVISADEKLGLVYLPTGNSANDHYGASRSADEDEYTASVVAVDVATGQVRWHFRTVDHDLWDYDLGAQPTLMDMEIDGRKRRVLLQGTKTGFIFVLDAATGEPLRPVTRRAVPQGATPGDRTAATQPQSAALPNFAGAPGAEPERLTEAHLFGLTPIDALLCRIQFRRMRYEGIYTPPTEGAGGMLLFPGTIGGLNWGGLSVNTEQQILVTNHSRLPNVVTLVPRAQVKDLAVGSGGARVDQAVAPMAGSPYGVTRPIWLSVLDVPCIAPPWGYLSATDLRSGKLLWTQPLGTGYDSGPLGIPTRLKITLGTTNIGGSVSTHSGLTFIAAAQDNFLRAFDTRTGELLWDARLPAGAQASPLTYMHQGRQYIAIAAGGHARLKTTPGDSVVVFALPRTPP